MVSSLSYSALVVRKRTSVATLPSSPAKGKKMTRPALLFTILTALLLLLAVAFLLMGLEPGTEEIAGRTRAR